MVGAFSALRGRHFLEIGFLVGECGANVKGCWGEREKRRKSNIIASGPARKRLDPKLPRYKRVHCGTINSRPARWRMAMVSTTWT